MNSTNNKVDGGNNNGHCILNLNIRSLSKHYDEFLIYLQSLENKNIYPKVIVLTETWISKDQLTYFPIKGYSSYISDRQDGTRSGGVIVYVCNNIKHTISILSTNTFQAISVVLGAQRSASQNKPEIGETELLAVYRDQRKRPAEFLLELEDTFLQKAHQKAFIIGDVNIDLLNTTASCSLLNLLNTYGFESYNNQPTRIGINKHGLRTETCLDHFHVRNINILSITTNNDASITDHMSVLATAELGSATLAMESTESDKVSVVHFMNWEKMRKLLSDETWDKLNFESVDQSFNSFLEIYKSYKTKCTEAKTVKIKNKNKKRAQWISDKSVNLSILKESLYKQLKKTDPKHESYADLKLNFKAVSSQLTKQIRTDKAKHYNNLLDNCHSSKEYWKELKRICKIDNKKSQKPIVLTNDMNENITEPEQIVEILNKHYATVSEQEIHKNSIFKTKVPTTYSLDQEKTVLNSFVTFEITTSEIHTAIKNLPNKRSCGSDGITAGEMKKFCNELLLPLTLIFNFSLQQGIFPKDFKISGIVPVPKVPNPKKPADYRPISLLSTVSKVFEAIMQKRMVNFLQKQNFFSNNQFGFLPRKSTSNALVAHLNEIVGNLESKKKVLGLYLDLAKAFDTVNHAILKEKLFRAGFRGTIYQWLASYLHGRQQYVKYKGINSRLLNVECGVPQGSTMGPLLFLIYVNSILELKLQGPVFSFADDTAVVYAGEKIEEAKRKAENDLIILSNWFLYHRICPNMQKTQCVQYTYKLNKNKDFITIIWHLPNCKSEPCDCPKLENSLETKYLGVKLNCNLNWKPHLDYLQSKLRKLNYLLYYLRKTVPPKVRLRVYQALYEPVLAYGIECWGGAAEYILQPVTVLQKAAIRAVAGAEYRDHTKPIFSKLKILSLQALYTRALTRLIHQKIIIIPEIVAVTQSLRFPRYILPLWKNKKAQKQASYQALKRYSSLPCDLQLYIGHPSFTKKLKQYLLEQST